MDGVKRGPMEEGLWRKKGQGNDSMNGSSPRHAGGGRKRTLSPPRSGPPPRLLRAGQDKRGAGVRPPQPPHEVRPGPSPPQPPWHWLRWPQRQWRLLRPPARPAPPPPPPPWRGPGPPCSRSIGRSDSLKAADGRAMGEGGGRGVHTTVSYLTYSPWAIYYKNEPSGIKSTKRG